MIVRNTRYRRWKNRLAMGVMVAMVLSILLPLASLLYTLLSHGLKTVNWGFIVSLPLAEPAGVGNAILGSMLILAVASVFAIPCGLLVGMYLSQTNEGRVVHITRVLLDVMSGIPAIVVGIFMYAVVVTPMRRSSLLAGGLALAMIMLPIFARTTEEALRSIPETVMEAGLGLGLPRRRVILRIILRGAVPTVFTGFFLALARVGGEAAPLLLTTGGSNYWPSHSTEALATMKPVVEPVASLPVIIYEYAKSPFEQQVANAWGASLLLVILILSVRLSTNAIIRWRYGQEGVRQ